MGRLLVPPFGRRKVREEEGLEVCRLVGDGVWLEADAPPETLKDCGAFGALAFGEMVEEGSGQRGIGFAVRPSNALTLALTLALRILPGCQWHRFGGTVRFGGGGGDDGGAQQEHNCDADDD